MLSLASASLLRERRSRAHVEAGAMAVKKRGVYVGGNVGDDVVTGKLTKYSIHPDLARDVSDLENPYLGLRAYTYSDRESFAGRKELVDETVRRLTEPGREQSLFFILGASGSGKSSLAQGRRPAGPGSALCAMRP